MKKKNVIIFAIIFVLATIIISFLIFNKKTLKKLDNIEQGLEEKISLNINDYGDFSKESNCKIDISKVNNSKIGTYTYYINCKKTRYKGNLIINDLIFPKVKMREQITRPINATISIDDFIEECIDQTKCRIYFKDEYSLKEKVKKTGKYDVEIHIVDEGKNVSKVFGTVIITTEEVKKYLACKIDETSENIKDASSIISEIVIGLNNNNEYNYVSYEQFIYQFDLDKFTNYKKNTNKDSEEFDNYYGEIIVNDEQHTISVKTPIYSSALKKEIGIINYENIKNYYEKKEYNCSLINK